MSKSLTLEQVLTKRPVNEARTKKLKNQVIMRHTGARLAEIRKSLKITQKALAKRVGVDQSNISRIELGKFSRLELNTLQKYIQALGGEVEVHARFGSNLVLLKDSEYEKTLKKSRK